jgi:hypothetical protein
MTLEDINFISKEQIRTHLLTGSDIYTDEHLWHMTPIGVACCTFDRNIINYKNTIKAVDILWKENCKVNLE